MITINLKFKYGSWADEIGKDFVQYKTDYFNDGSLKKQMIVPGFGSGFSRLLNFEIVWQYKNISEQIELYNIVKHINEKYPNISIELVMPYVPNARQDKLDEYLPTLKYFCKFINDLNFSKVKVLDVHSQVTLMLLDRAEEIPLSPIIKSIPKEEYNMICFLDYKTMLKYSKLFGDVSYRDIVYGEKVRDKDNADIVRYRTCFDPMTQSVCGRKVLLFHDIASAGDDLFLCAEALKKEGAEDVVLYVTHCETGFLLNRELETNTAISKVITTESVDRDAGHNKLQIINYKGEA